MDKQDKTGVLMKEKERRKRGDLTELTNAVCVE
jgi:hypothetical protein